MYTVGTSPEAYDKACVCILNVRGKRSMDHWTVDHALYGWIRWDEIDPYLPAEAFKTYTLFGRTLYRRRLFSVDTWQPTNELEKAQALVYAQWLCDALNARANELKAVEATHLSLR